MNRMPNNKFYIIFIFTILFFISCDYIGSDHENNTVKIYSGGYGYNVAFRLEGNKIYSGSYGYNVAYRIDGNKIYSGSYGFNVAYRIEEK